MGYLGPPSLGCDLYRAVSGQKISGAATRLGHNRTGISQLHLTLGLLLLLKARSTPAYVSPLLLIRLLPPIALEPGVGVMLSRAFSFSIPSLSISVPSKFCIKRANLYQILLLGLLSDQGLFDFSTLRITQAA